MFCNFLNASGEIQITYPVGHRPILYSAPICIQSKEEHGVIYLPSIVNSKTKNFFKKLFKIKAHTECNYLSMRDTL